MEKIHYHQHGECPGNNFDHKPAGTCDRPPDFTLLNEFDCQPQTTGSSTYVCRHLA